METKTASQWMDNCTVYVVIDCYTTLSTRSIDYGECWARLEVVLKENPWMKRSGAHCFPEVLRVTRNLQKSYEARVPGLKPSQLYAFGQYMTSIAEKLVALGYHYIARVDFRLEIRSETISVERKSKS